MCFVCYKTIFSLTEYEKLRNIHSTTYSQSFLPLVFFFLFLEASCAEQFRSIPNTQFILCLQFFFFLRFHFQFFSPFAFIINFLQKMQVVCLKRKNWKTCRIILHLARLWPFYYNNPLCQPSPPSLNSYTESFHPLHPLLIIIVIITTTTTTLLIGVWIVRFVIEINNPKHYNNVWQ